MAELTLLINAITELQASGKEPNILARNLFIKNSVSESLCHEPEGRW